MANIKICRANSVCDLFLALAQQLTRVSNAFGLIAGVREGIRRRIQENDIRGIRNEGEANRQFLLINPGHPGDRGGNGREHFIRSGAVILAVLAGSRHRKTVGAEALPDFPGRTQSRSTGNDLPRSAKNLLFVLSMEVALPLAARSMSMLGPVADSGIWAPLLHRINHPTPAGR